MNTKTIFITSFLILLIKLGICQKIETANGFTIGTGVNISQWLSQTSVRGTEREKYIIKTDFDTIASLGFDHIRLPVDEVQLWDEKDQKLDEAFILLHNAINWAIQKKLRIIIDLHIIRSHFFNAEEKPLWTDIKEQEKLINLWIQLSAELSKYPNNFVAYELLNEAVADNPDDWNNLIAKLYTSLRKNEMKRTIVIGSNKWQEVETFPELEVPQNDKNIILSFHYYKPFALTHYRTPWTSLKDYDGEVIYPGEVIPENAIKKYPKDVKHAVKWAMGYYNKETIQKEINTAVEVAAKHKLPLYCGEYGVYPPAPDESALRWYSDMNEIFRKNNIAFCHWAYKGDFPIVDDKLVPNRSITDIISRTK